MQQKQQNSADATVVVDRDDLIAAWKILENLTVSLDQIGGAVGPTENAGSGQLLRDMLAAYLTPKVVQEIAAARSHLSRYLSREEAEALSDEIPYWDYSGLPQGAGTKK